MQKHTEIPELRSAYASMATGIKKPENIAWKLYDAARGRPVAPLGGYPAIAEEIAEAGGSFYSIARPLTVMLAHLRRRCSAKMSTDMRQALFTAKRESDEAESVSLSIACSLANLQESELIAEEKEAVEAALAWEHVAEITADKLAAMQEAR